MGVADIGLRDVGGQLVGYELNTTSAEGTVSLTTAQSVYVDGDGPDMFGIQLNSVLTNVTLFGDSSYQFWTQNFASYTSSSGQLSFGDNIWNFSSLSGEISSNVFYAHGPNGSLYAPIFYYATGPTFVIHYPFSVTFYLNATTVADRPAVFFNYTVANASFRSSGSFDFVVFNSSLGPPGAAAPPALFQVNGFAYDPVGLLNDIELSVLGNDNGDTTTFYQISGTASIAYWNSSQGAYDPVPSAVNAGADTGETSDGVASYYTGTAPVAELGLGPSFLSGLWNTTTPPGVREITSTTTPASTLLLVNPGATRNASSAQWVPTTPSGTTVFYLPNTGTYFLDYVLSDYSPATTASSPAANSSMGIRATLGRNPALGIYTPLIVWGNSNLADFAASGTGTAANPYVLYSAEPGALYPEFDQWNDFLFPVFPGLLLVQTTDYVEVSPAPFLVNYPAWMLPEVQALGLPTSNHLQDEFWNVSHVVVENATISGWLSAYLLSFYPLGSVIFWNSSGNLVAANTFEDDGASLALYGGTNNTVWGNRFLNGSTTATDPAALLNGPANQTGVWESESGDLLYNNFFGVPTPAYTPTFDPLSCQVACQSASYLDRWNVSREDASATQTVLGVALTGSIIATSYQGGNYWWNYGGPSNPYGDLPYVDRAPGSPATAPGGIAVGGDDVPLVPFALFPVSFDEVGLSAGLTWQVTTPLGTVATNGSSLSLEGPNGTYSVSVEVLGSRAWDIEAPSNFTVQGAAASVAVGFIADGSVTFTEAGLAAGHLWNVTLAGPGGASYPANGTGSSLVLGPLTPGNYTFLVASPGYTAAPARGAVAVAPGTAGSEAVDFSLVPTLVFEETGLAPGTAWTVLLTQAGGSASSSVTSANASLAFSIFDSTEGPYAFTVSAIGYAALPSSGTGTLPENATQSIAFAATAVPLVLDLVRPTCASVAVDDGPSSASTCQRDQLSLLPGAHTIEVTAAGYYPWSTNVTISAGVVPVPLSVSLTPRPAASSPLGSVGGWVVGALGAVVVVLLLALFLSRRRRRPAPGPLKPAESANAPPAVPSVVPEPAAEVPPSPSSVPPWSEEEVEPGPESPIEGPH